MLFEVKYHFEISFTEDNKYARQLKENICNMSSKHITKFHQKWIFCKQRCQVSYYCCKMQLLCWFAIDNNGYHISSYMIHIITNFIKVFFLKVKLFKYDSIFKYLKFWCLNIFNLTIFHNPFLLNGQDSFWDAFHAQGSELFQNLVCSL